MIVLPVQQLLHDAEGEVTDAAVKVALDVCWHVITQRTGVIKQDMEIRLHGLL